MDEPVGISIVLLVDKSGSLESSDPSRIRWQAIKNVAREMALTRDDLDKVAIVLFGTEASDFKGWSRWSEIADYIEAAPIDDMELDSGTNIVAGMERAHEMINELWSRHDHGCLYKSVILFSDGYPEPDYYGQQSIIYNRLIGEAKAREIIYACSFLINAGSYSAYPTSDDYELINAIMWEIAKGTDYISGTPEGERPLFYSSIENPGELESDIRLLISQLGRRLVPQGVKLIEEINPKLKIIGRPQFSGSGFNSIANVLGWTEDDEPDLEEALNVFAETGRFQIRLNELKEGDAVLKFTVGLNQDHLSVEELSGSTVPLGVDELTSSRIEYLHFISGSLQRVRLNFSDSTIAPNVQVNLLFMMGIFVAKQLQGDKVTINLVNATATNLDYFTLMEIPSYYVTAFDLVDNYEFNPMSLIIDRIFSHYCEDIFPTTLVNSLAKEFNQQLSYFDVSFVGSGATDSDDLVFSNVHPEEDETIARGIYLRTSNVLERGQRILEFKVRGITYKNTGTEPTNINYGVDSVKFRLSQYRIENRGWDLLEHNPDFAQLAAPGNIADLYVGTCFDQSNVIGFYDSLFNLDEPIDRNMVETLNSGDIHFELVPPGVRLGVGSHAVGQLKVKVHNGGNAQGQSRIKAVTYLLPITEKDGVNRWGEAVICQGRASFGVEPHSETIVTIDCSVDSRMGTEGMIFLNESNPIHALHNASMVIAITKVIIDKASNELMDFNNSGMEIVVIRNRRL